MPIFNQRAAPPLCICSVQWPENFVTHTNKATINKTEKLMLALMPIRWKAFFIISGVTFHETKTELIIVFQVKSPPKLHSYVSDCVYFLWQMIYIDSTSVLFSQAHHVVSGYMHGFICNTIIERAERKGGISIPWLPHHYLGILNIEHYPCSM